MVFPDTLSQAKDQAAVGLSCAKRKRPSFPAGVMVVMAQAQHRTHDKLLTFVHSTYTRNTRDTPSPGEAHFHHLMTPSL